jgi:hypothetical protein
MKTTSDEVRDSFKSLDLMHVAPERKNKILSKKNHNLDELLCLLSPYTIEFP